jgi:hypothetical protein
LSRRLAFSFPSLATIHFYAGMSLHAQPNMVSNGFPETLPQLHQILALEADHRPDISHGTEETRFFIEADAPDEAEAMVKFG